MTYAIDEVRDALLALDAQRMKELLESSLSSLTPLEVAEEVISPALLKIGEMWEEGEANLSQIFLASKMCDETLSQILPKEAHWRKDSPVIGITNFDDHHSLGKKILYMVLRADGFDVIDLGWTDSHSIGAAVMENRVEVLLVSTLMLRSALKVKEIPDIIKARGRKVIMVVGGAPFLFDPELGRGVGADAIGSNGADASELIKGLMEARK